MKNFVILFILFNLGFSLSYTETANTLAKGQFEVGLFQPLQYGITDKIEFSTHPLYNFLIPNGNLKIQHNDFGGFNFASKYSITYPTILLRTLTREGTGGFIAPDPTIPEIPQIVGVKSEILLTTELNDFYVTQKYGVGLGIGYKPDIRTVIELPIVYPRLEIFYDKYSINFGFDLRYSPESSLDYLVDTDFIILPEADSDKQFFFEHKGMLVWNKSDSFQICGGYKLVYGEYPFGTQLHILPLFDMKWGW